MAAKTPARSASARRDGAKGGHGLEEVFAARHERAKITDWVLDELRTAIIDLRLAPGEPLREATLADSLGVSKTPVREALARLESEGLVEMASFKGAVVAGYTRQDLVEIYELRELVETWAVREAARTMGAAEHDRLDALMEASKRLREKGRTSALERVVDDFDAFVFEQVTNRRISALVDNMRAHLTRIGRLTAEIPGRLVKSVDEHVLVAQALRRGDADAADAALRAHIASVRVDQLASLDGRAQDVLG